MTDSTSHTSGASGAGGAYGHNQSKQTGKKFPHDTASGDDDSMEGSKTKDTYKTSASDPFKRMLPDATDKEIAEFKKMLEKNLGNEFAKAAKRSKEAKAKWKEDDQ